MRDAPRRRLRARTVTIAALAALGTAALAVTLVLLTGDDDPGKSAVNADAASTSAAPRTPSATPASPSGSPPPSASVVPNRPTVGAGGQVSLSVAAADSAIWVSVTDSAGKQLFEGTLSPGQTRDFSDPAQLKVVIGNAQNARIAVNGKDLGPAGATDRVVRLTILPDPAATG
ncbi:DUF4115 domain-containing protein [Yinghuangia sp. YIM S09857]|uniref:DUF4115 domain-containing protein n=1 Tax=Yinghuangia sp. YIM S09857 TaxID=3436929 RepID=UPI003F5351BF